MRWIASCAVIVFVAGSAAAQETGWHAGIGFALANESFDNTDGLDADDGKVIAFQGGYRFNERFAVEGEWEYFDGFDLDGTAGPVSVDGDVDGWMLMASAKFYPMTGRFEPYLLGGLGFMDVEADVSANALGVGASFDEDDFAPVWQLGLGLDFKANENWTVELETTYKFPTSDLDDFKFWTLGLNLQYRF